MKDLASQATTQDVTELDVAALQAEVAKWQERVPKLAAALRERSEELEQVRGELRDLQRDPDNGAAADARVSTRDELIRELEGKLAEASAQQRESAGQLHSAKLEVAEQAAQIQLYKDKWQAATATLDGCVVEKTQLAEELSQAENRWQDNESNLLQQHQDMQSEFLQEIKQLNEHIEQVEANHSAAQQQSERQQQEIDHLQGQCDSLTNRNKTLQDTATLANNQMASMGEEITVLNTQVDALSEDLSQVNEQRHTALSEAGELREQLAALQHQVQTNDQVQLDLRNAWAREVQDLDSSVNTQAAAVERLQQELVDVVSRLSEEVSAASLDRDEAVKTAQQVTLQAEQAQAAADSAKAELERVRHQLDERSNLVRELEQETQSQQRQHAQQLAQLQQDAGQARQLEDALSEANNRADTQHAHAQQLEAKLQQQMELLTQLEDELSQTSRQAQDDVRLAEEAQRELKLQQAQLNERCEELTAEVEQLRANATSNPTSNPISDAASNSGAETGSGRIAPDDSRHEALALQKVLTERTEELEDLRWRLKQQTEQSQNGGAPDNVLMVLNQQLKDARDENTRLLQKLADQPAAADDLTQIKGVGRKLAAQLRDLGYASYAQIAELAEAALESTDHPLYTMRSRVIRDQWISQARQLLQNSSAPH